MAIGSDKSFLATREGFEPPELLHSSVFKTATLNRTLPPCRFVAAPARFELTSEGVKDLRTTVALRGKVMVLPTGLEPATVRFVAG